MSGCKNEIKKDKIVLTIQTVEKIIEGCRNVKEDNKIHRDAKELATMIIRDCNDLLLFIKND